MTEPRSLELRASDAEREQALELLRESFAAGRLTHDELDERTAAVYAARTRGELAGVTRDLPDDPRDGLTRAERLAGVVADLVVEGGTVESQSPYNAVLVRTTPPNHVAHGLLTLFAGIWGFVWLALALSPRRERLLVEVDERGEPAIARVR